MSDFNFDLFEDESILPQRSKLYHLLMEGRGTGQQESLLDYVHRLALAHRLRVMDLLSTLVIPETSIHVGDYRLRFSKKHSRTINGYGKYARELSEALSTLTGVSALEVGTFIPWQTLFDPQAGGLLYPKRRWCPTCIDDADRDGRPIIIPLLWSVRCVSHCHVHLSALVDCCASCGAQPKYISETMAIGRCEKCGHSLGLRAGLLEANEPISLRERFAVEAISEMIALGGAAVDFGRPELLASILKEVAKATSDGSVFTLAKKLRVGPHTLAGWVNLDSRPRLDAFIEVCYRIGHSPIDLLSGKALGQGLVLRPGAPPEPRRLHRLSMLQVAAIEAEISQVIQSETAFMDANSLAIKHNTSVGFLKYRLPQAYAKLTAHRKRTQAKLHEASLAERSAKARKVVRELFSHGTHVPISRLKVALKQAKLNYTCPHVQTAAKSELSLLRQNQMDFIREASRDDVIGGSKGDHA